MRKKILSVGIDIGTSTTCLVFSNLYVEDVGGFARLPDAQIVEKTVLYRSPIYFTPLLSDTELDVEGIAEIVAAEYRQAGISPQAVDTGAVIITGDTARKSNAQKVLDRISQEGGDFVVATAGPELESILAGKGSGAQRYSREKTEVVANLDVGGGTTNVATFYNGQVVDADCFDIGGRLVRFQPGSWQVAYCFPKLQALAATLGINAAVGQNLGPEAVTKITDTLARTALEKLTIQPRSDLYYQLSTTPKDRQTHRNQPVDAISFSGGVGDLIYQEELPDALAYQDIGVYLARSFQRALAEFSGKVIRPAETIGATVIGAGSHSIEVSGATITVTNTGLLPLKNIPILKVEQVRALSEASFQQRIQSNIRWLQGQDGEQDIALAVDWGARMRYHEICTLADWIITGTNELLAPGKLLIVLLLGDYGKVLGQSLKARLPAEQQVLCIDGVDVADGDFLDIGKPLGVGDAVPVVIKTLAFSY